MPAKFDNLLAAFHQTSITKTRISAQQVKERSRAVPLDARCRAMEVIQADGKIYVANGQRRVGPFDTNAAARLWIDQHGDEGRGDTDAITESRMVVNGSLQLCTVLNLLRHGATDEHRCVYLVWPLVVYRTMAKINGGHQTRRW
jgi:hypothetical protein